MADPLDELRGVAARRVPDADPALAAYLEKVRTRAHAVVDADLEAVRAAGFSEDEIFEQTVAVAIEEGLRRLEAGLGVLR